MTYYDVVIATPGNNFEVGYLKSLMDTVAMLNEKKISYKFVSGQSSIVSEARNQTICDTEKNHEVLNGEITYKKIFWIDSDMGWTPEHFLKLYESDLDIVSGVAVRADGKLAFGGSLENSEHVFLQFSKPFEVSYAGFAFICLKSGVMESIFYPWFKLVYSYNQDGESVLTGEDAYFVIKARAEGYSTFIDPSVRVSHFKMKPLIYKDVDFSPIENEEVLDEATDEFLKEFLF